MYDHSLLFLTGLTLIIAYDDLSKNKDATQSSTYPPHKNDPDKYVAGNAVDRDVMTCMRADSIGVYSRDQTVWWKVDLGRIHSIHSVDILFKNYDGFEIRQQGRFAGFSIFVSTNGTRDNTSLCYKDGPQLPPLNFTTTCLTSGRYVTFYNERLDGVTYPDGYVDNTIYTELCEVTVHGCQTSGVYGDSCKKRCPTNCRNNACHIQNGTCFGCAPGWIGTTCYTKCVGGWFGQNCKQQCSGHCRNNIPCNHVTGQCDKGCAAGWSGTICDEVCLNGTYGNNCVHNCSGNCLDDSPCNRQTGHCDSGCKPGYTNALCSERCLTGYYGYRCENSCSRNCLNNVDCDHIDGRCRYGCKAGYIGNLCTASCKEGYYGENCTHVCSSNCKTCRPTDGACSCHAGWMGSNCSIGCIKSYGEDCRYPCNEHCVNRTCNRFHGICQFGCESGYHGQKCEQEFPPTSSLSTVAAGFIGASVSACVFIATAVAIFVIRRKGFFIVGSNSSNTKDSTYAEIENQRSGDAMYQELSMRMDHELTVSESDKAYQNLALQ